MFQEITDKLDAVFRRLRGQGKLTESNIADALRDVRRVLLEADVNYKVVKQFIADVQAKAVGREVLKSITPGQMVIKIIFDELLHLLGESHVPLKLGHSFPNTVLLAGLQGSGKTTLAGKLAVFLRQRGNSPLLVAADVYRPAAIQQLQVVGSSIGIPVFAQVESDVIKICQEALDYARKNMFDTIIVDTAGRLHVDEAMMDELIAIKTLLQANEVLFVADGMTGQDAVNTAKIFNDKIDFDGVVLTKMDGDARGGAALSIRAVTGKPIKFIGVGEKSDQLEPFYPDRIASRILGKGDVVSLVERAQSAVDAETAHKMQQKFKQREFSLEDFFDQLQQIKKMGPLQDLMGMIPGANKMLKGMQVDDRGLIQAEAIIKSMTPQERRSPQILNGSRRKRIALGSGTRIQDVNRLLEQYKVLQKMMKQMKQGGGLARKMPFGW
ncbi:MAG TPA: signal recognition particle protein [bacterium]|nr:signal recognition particle protein [bacterium]HPG46867.1 signal recognition particle protein [bacterium]HPM99153.1 signal recognition particle protein [bacterium]